MQAVIGALRVNLGLDSAAFDKGLSEAQSQLQRVGAQMQQVGQNLTRALTVPLAGVGAGIAAALGRTSSQLVEVQNQARLAGQGVEEFQKLAFAAESVGIARDKLADILKDANDKIGDFLATGGGELKEFFETIAPQAGVSAEDFIGLDSLQVLQKVAATLDQVGASAAQRTFILESVADEATALLPLLQDNSRELDRLRGEADRLGIASSESVDQARNFVTAMTELRAALSGLSAALVESGVLEAFAQFIRVVADGLTALRDINPDLAKFVGVAAGVAAALGPAVIALGLLVTGIGAIGAPAIAAAAAIAGITAAAVAFWPEIVRAKDAVLDFAAGVLSSLQTLAADIVAVFRELPAKMVQVGADIIAGLKNGITNKIQSVKDAVTGGAQSIIDGVKSTFGIQSPSRVFREIGEFLMDGLGQGVESRAGEVQDSMSGISSDITSGFKGAFKSVLFEGESFASAMSNLLKSVSSKLFDAGMNSLFAGFGIPGFARGTNYAPGGLALVGERGPELVNLPRGSQVIPNHRLGGASNIGVEVSIGDTGGLRVIARDEAGRVLARRESAIVERSVAATYAANGERPLR